MCDGSRTFTVNLTEAQYDVLKVAINETTECWQQGTEQHKRNNNTLARAVQRLDDAWQQGRRG